MTPSPHTPEADPDAPDALDAAAMLALSQAESARVRDAFNGPTAIIILGWGIAWTVGFLAIWTVIVVPHTPEALRIGAGVLFAVLMIGGVALSMIFGNRADRGLRGVEKRQGTLYGYGWALGSIGVVLLASALAAAGMPLHLLGVFYPAAYSLIVGLLYLTGSALWKDRYLAFLGFWIAIVGLGAAFIPMPHNYLVMGVLGGGTFLVSGLLSLRAQRRRRRAWAELPR